MNRLIAIYNRLYRYYGPQHWWPGNTRFEVIVGAILTQNTSWSNVEKAINNLKKANLLSPDKLRRIDNKKLAAHIRPAGYYNVKAKRLKSFIEFLYEEYGGSLAKLSSENLKSLRKALLNVKGIGPETCDSIALYAFRKKSFVVDAYTKRIFSRHGFVKGTADYHDIRRFFMDHLPASEKIYNEYHALIVRLAKDFCKTKPKCINCPMK